MHNTFENIDLASENNDGLRLALYELAAQAMAAQAFALANSTLAICDEAAASSLIEQVSGNLAVTTRRMPKGGDTTVGKRAQQILMSLARLRPNFVPPSFS